MDAIAHAHAAVVRNKKCCLSKDQKEQSAKLLLDKAAAETQENARIEDQGKFEQFDRLVDSVPGLIESRKLDEAEAVGKTLLDGWPNMVDGLEAYAKVYEAKGDLPKAIGYHERTIAHMLDNDGFEEEMIKYVSTEVDRLKTALSHERKIT